MWKYDKILNSILFASVALMSNPAVAAVTFLDASVRALATAGAGGKDVEFIEQTNIGYADVLTLPTPLLATTATVQKIFTGASATDTVTSSIRFLSTESGVFHLTHSNNVAITLSNMDLNFGSPDYDYPYFAEAGDFFNPTSGYYEFNVDTDSIINLRYNDSGFNTYLDSVPFGKHGVSYDLYSLSTGSDISAFKPVGAGSDAYYLAPGHYSLYVSDAYSSEFVAQGDLTQNDSRGTQSNVYDGTLSFRITAAIPEPATWCMMIAGFGMIGGAMRKRKQVTVRCA